MSYSVNSVIGSSKLTLESGKLAQQANGSVLVSYGDCVLLTTATMSKPREGIDFFPLTIDFEERHYARGKIPGSFFRREGRPSTPAILTMRLTDRPLRPLFPKGFRNEVQVVSTTFSADVENPLDIPSIIGASTALTISDIPFGGPIGATRMGYVNGSFVVNPTFAQLEESQLDLVVAGSKSGVLMMEAGAEQLSEDLIFEAIERAQEVNLEVVELQEQLARSLGKPKVDYESNAYSDALVDSLASEVSRSIGAALDSSMRKAELDSNLASQKADLIEALSDVYPAKDIGAAFEDRVGDEVRVRILRGNRPDGRGLRDIRPISCEVALLPRTHGSGLFARGETQVLCVATLGSVGDAQKLDTLNPQESESFMLHYNFPPYSVGETRRMGGPGRREIGHGALAQRALTPILPDQEVFPYTLRLVSEILSSNGSTSMGSVCASTLALMDAGVPIETPVAGISIGLVTDGGGEYVTLTDIQGMEDHVGDMDFKVAGSRAGITAIQLDIKVQSITFDVIRDALEQAKEARLLILDRIRETISESRTEMSPYAPRVERISVPVDKIGIIIGPGGKTIRGIVEQTKATVDVQDDGTVLIGSADADSMRRAVGMVQDLVREVKVGEIYTGKVVKIMTFGAFVQLLPGKDGLVHISELADHRVPSVEDVVSIGEEVTVIVTEIDNLGRVNLSRRALLEGSSDSQDGSGDGTPTPEGQQDDRPERPDGAQSPPSYPRSKPGGERSGYRPQGPRQGGQRGRPRSGPGGTPGYRPPR